VKLEVVTVGTELLLGYTVDTNAAELGRALAAAGIEVVRRTTVADRPDAIRAAVADALQRTGVVVTTGGLGPTRDDVTKRVVAELCGKRLVLDPAVLSAIEARFKQLGRWPMPESNRSQAEVPEGATVLPNPRGTAPGLWLEDEGGRLVARVHPGREGPDRYEPLDVGGFDLVERAVAPALIVAPDLQPVLGFRFDEPFVGHGAVHALCHHRRRQHREAKHRCERRKGSGCLHDRPSSCRSGLYD